MAVSEKDVKKLWGLAAGRCSRPGCEQECIRFLDSNEPTVIGEMAHVIAKKPDGPRGQASGGENTYKNLILLCPTHHTEIDKAPEGTFSVKEIHEWKRLHEERVRNSFLSPKHPDQRSLGIAIKRLLIESHAAWQQYGPESAEAQRNPMSSLADVWQLRKLDTVVPNNRRVIHLIEQNRELFDIADYQNCVAFVEHAEGFERNCYVRTEGIPRFPADFERLVDRYAGLQ
jgi:hypothetical protein